MADGFNNVQSGADATPAREQGEKNARMTAGTRELEAIFDRAERKGHCVAMRPGGRHYQIMRRRVRAKTALNPFPGLYARRAFWDDLRPGAQALCVIRGAHELHERWTFCHYSAALVYGLSVSYRLLEQVHIQTKRAARSRSSKQICRHCTRSQEDQVGIVQGVPVTSLKQTLLDCLIAAQLPDALAMADSALRIYGIDRDELIAFMEDQGKRRHGIQSALHVAALADGRAESGGESILRGTIIEEGYLPPTDLQVKLPDVTDPRRTFRADLLWSLPDGRRIVGELDGAEKYVNEGMRAGRTVMGVLLDERQRESRITALGMPVMRFQFSKVREPGYVARTLQAFGIPRACS